MCCDNVCCDNVCCDCLADRFYSTTFIRDQREIQRERTAFENAPLSRDDELHDKSLKEKVKQVLKSEDLKECCICRDDFNNPEYVAIPPCKEAKHLIYKSCGKTLNNSESIRLGKSCALCRRPGMYKFMKVESAPQQEEMSNGAVDLEETVSSSSSGRATDGDKTNQKNSQQGRANSSTSTTPCPVVFGAPCNKSRQRRKM